jgi:succinoglycan biosynthesis protein ExoL
LGKIQHGRYLKRIFVIINALTKTRQFVRRFDVVYAFGLDMAALAIIASIGLRKRLVLETGDIRELQTAGGPIGYIVRLADRFIVDHAKLLVCTTTGFVDGYYRSWLKTDTRALVIENKLEPETDHADNQEGGPLTIGYFGLLRCQRSWKTLEAINRENPAIRILVAGIAKNPNDIPRKITEMENVHWLGEYKSPTDLPKLYGQVDLIWASPFPGVGEHNWRWARSNRYYEACHFGVPLIVYKDSGDGRAVRKHDIGMEVGEFDMSADVKKVLSITREEISLWKRNLKNLPVSEYTFTTESIELANEIWQLLPPTARPQD